MSKLTWRVYAATLSLAAALGASAIVADEAAAQACPAPCECRADSVKQIFLSDCATTAYVAFYVIEDGCCELEHDVVCDQPEPCQFVFEAGASSSPFDPCQFHVYQDGVLVHKKERNITVNWAQYPPCGELRTFEITANGESLIAITIRCFDCAG